MTLPSTPQDVTDVTSARSNSLSMSNETGSKPYLQSEVILTENEYSHYMTAVNTNTSLASEDVTSIDCELINYMSRLQDVMTGMVVTSESTDNIQHVSQNEPNPSSNLPCHSVPQDVTLDDQEYHLPNESTPRNDSVLHKVMLNVQENSPPNESAPKTGVSTQADMMPSVNTLSSQDATNQSDGRRPSPLSSLLSEITRNQINITTGYGVQTEDPIRIVLIPSPSRNNNQSGHISDSNTIDYVPDSPSSKDVTTEPNAHLNFGTANNATPVAVTEINDPESNCNGYGFLVHVLSYRTLRFDSGESMCTRNSLRGIYFLMIFYLVQNS